MATKAFQKIYTKITQITKATCSLKATGVGYDELATVEGKLAQVVKIAGDDGVPVEYHVIFWKSELIDFVILQQDAFDEIDAVTPMERQEDILNMIIDICHTEFEFDNFNEVMDYFKKMINICKQMNYSKFKSEQYEGFQKQLKELIEERKLQS